MKKFIGKFLAKIRLALFAARINREISKKISPQINQGADSGYPFSSVDELARLRIRAGFDTSRDLQLIELAAADMPEAYAEAFRYILYRDIDSRLKMYMEVCENQIQPKPKESRLVANQS